MQPAPQISPFMPGCSACRCGRGLPVEVTAMQNERTLTYRCSHCGNRWVETHVPRGALSWRSAIEPSPLDEPSAFIATRRQRRPGRVVPWSDAL
jgi:hypothetical protein